MQYYDYKCAYCKQPIELHKAECDGVPTMWLWVLKEGTDTECLHGPMCEWCGRDMTDEQCPNSKDICVDCCGED